MPRDTINPFELLLSEVSDLPMPETTRRRIAEVFRSYAGQRFYCARKHTIARERLETAARFMQAGETRTTVHHRLVALYGISRDTAERITTQVLSERLQQARQHTPPGRTT